MPWNPLGISDLMCPKLNSVSYLVFHFFISSNGFSFYSDWQAADLQTLPLSLTPSLHSPIIHIPSYWRPQILMISPFQALTSFPPDQDTSLLSEFPEQPSFHTGTKNPDHRHLCSNTFFSLLLPLHSYDNISYLIHTYSSVNNIDIQLLY